MSSSRSIAAARQRRAGEAPPVAQRGPGTSINSQQAFAQQQMQQGNPNQLPPQAPQVPVGKLSVGDAFALVTIRLGRIETIIQKLEAEGVIGPNAQHGSDSIEHDENMRLVDDTVIRNIVARLGDLEKGQTKLTTLTQNKKDTDLNSEEIFKMVENQTSDLQSQVSQLKNELRDTKEMLMKLQSFSMETNQKIISIVLTQEKQETLLKEVEVEDSELEVEASSDSHFEENADSEKKESEDEEKTENDGVTDEAALKSEEDTLKSEDDTLKSENDALKSESGALKNEEVSLKTEKASLKQNIKKNIKNELLKINSNDV